MKDAVGALLFDFGGVVIEVDFDRVCARWAELAGVSFEEVRSRFTHGEAYQRHERGEIEAPEYFRTLRRELAIDLSDAQLTDGWMRVLGAEIPETIALLPGLAARLPVYLFSNTNRTHYEYWSKRYAQALRPFRRLFVSFQMGVRKPERAAFDQVAREIGVPPGRILFFDDTAENIEGARVAGLRTVAVRTPEDVKRAVAPWLDEARRG